MGRNRAASERQLRDQLERIARRNARIGRLIEDYAAPLDSLGWSLMQLLGRQAPVRSSELAEQSGTSRPSVSRSVTALEEAGLVSTEPDPHDGRATLVRLTPSGEQQLESMTEMARSRIHAITDGFTAEEVDTLSRLLTRLNDNADDITVVPPRYTARPTAAHSPERLAR